MQWSEDHRSSNLLSCLGVTSSTSDSPKSRGEIISDKQELGMGVTQKFQSGDAKWSGVGELKTDHDISSTCMLEATQRVLSRLCRNEFMIPSLFLLMEPPEGQKSHWGAN